jgi:hypothetical protein
MAYELKTIDDINREVTEVTGAERVPVRDNSGDARITTENFSKYFAEVFLPNITRIKTEVEPADLFPGQDGDGNFKATAEAMYNLFAGDSALIIGEDVRTLSVLREPTAIFPWFCLSYPNQNFTSANFPLEFIDKRRNLKHIYNEFNDPLLDPKAESFSGTWASNVFTLANNAANNAMLAELAEDWLYHGSPTSNWRIINDGTLDFKMTTMDVTARTITVDLDSETATGTNIIIYTNRVYRQATQARHFSEAGLATYQAGGGKSGRLFRRDQMQVITGHFDAWSQHALQNGGTGGSGALSVGTSGNAAISNGSGSATNQRLVFDSANSPNARTSATTAGETIAKSSSDYRYIYVGSYTA